MSTIVILGSGPSLNRVDVDKARTLGRVMAINTSYQMAPWCDLLYACDYAWWDVYAARTASLRCEKWTQDKRAAADFGLNHIQSQNGRGLDAPPFVINTGHNSGHQAIHLACVLGFQRIALLGFDFQRVGGRSHWHGDHPRPLNNLGNMQAWVDAMNVMAIDLVRADIDVINCSPSSVLTCFRRAPIDDVIQELAA